MARAREVQPLDLAEATEQLLEECRMVLPGIQALFGFQLVAVLSSGFPALVETLKVVHLCATVLTAVAIALVMAPAAYHRQSSPRAATAEMVRLSTRLLLTSMVPLSVSISLELYVVSYAIVNQAWVAGIALAVFGLLVFLWFVLPRRVGAPSQEVERSPRTGGSKR